MEFPRALIVASHAHKIRALGREWPLVRNSEDSDGGLNSNLIMSDSTIFATYKQSLEHCKRNFQQRKMHGFLLYFFVTRLFFMAAFSVIITNRYQLLPFHISVLDNTYNFSFFHPEYGNLDFLMKGFRDSQHSDVLTPGAGPVAIGSRMYFSVEVISADKDLHLLLERCWATPTILKRDLSQRELVLQG